MIRATHKTNSSQLIGCCNACYHKDLKLLTDYQTAEVSFLPLSSCSRKAWSFEAKQLVSQFWPSILSFTDCLSTLLLNESD